MGELIYIANHKDSIEIIKSLWIYLFLLIIMLLVYKINKSFLQERLNQYTKALLGMILIFILLFAFVDYYALFKVSNNLKIALVNNKKCKYVEGIVIDYANNYGQNKEFFVIDKINFRLEDSSNTLFKNYNKLIKKKSLKLRVEYIDFPKYNTTVVRIWKL
jgi:hypothetical protein